MAALLAFVNGDMRPAAKYAEFIKAVIDPERVFYSPEGGNEEIARLVCGFGEEEEKWTEENTGNRLEIAGKDPAVHVISGKEFEIVYRMVRNREVNREIIIEGGKELWIEKEKEEWEWFLGNSEEKHNKEERKAPEKLRTSCCTMRELQAREVYRVYVLNMEMEEIKGVRLVGSAGGYEVTLIPEFSLPTGPSVLHYPVRPQVPQLYLSLWSRDTPLCGLWSS